MQDWNEEEELEVRPRGDVGDGIVPGVLVHASKLGARGGTAAGESRLKVSPDCVVRPHLQKSK